MEEDQIEEKEKEIVKESRSHVKFEDIFSYIAFKRYPNDTKDRGLRANIRRACKNYNVIEGALYHKRKRRILYSGERMKLYNKLTLYCLP